MKILSVLFVSFILVSSIDAGVYKYPSWVDAQRYLYGNTTLMEKTLQKYKNIADKYPLDCEAQYKVAELTYYLWEVYTFEKKNESLRTRLIQIGVKYSKRALKINPNSVPAMFWFVANIGVYGLMKGPQNVLKYAPIGRKLLFRMAKQDPNMIFERGSWGRLLGKLYAFLPSFPMSFGDIDKGIALLKKVYQKYPDYGINIYFLAEAYAIAGKDIKAMDLLEKGIKIIGNSDLTLFVNRKDLRIMKNLLKLMNKHIKEGKNFVKPTELIAVEHN